MKPTIVDLEHIVDEYLAGGRVFWDFYHTLMDIWMDAELTDEESDHWEEIYEAVYMAAPEPVDTADRGVGIVGETELKSRLGEFRRRE